MIPFRRRRGDAWLHGAYSRWISRAGSPTLAHPNDAAHRLAQQDVCSSQTVTLTGRFLNRCLALAAMALQGQEKSPGFVDQVPGQAGRLHVGDRDALVAARIPRGAVVATTIAAGAGVALPDSRGGTCGP